MSVGHGIGSSSPAARAESCCENLHSSKLSVSEKTGCSGDQSLKNTAPKGSPCPRPDPAAEGKVLHGTGHAGEGDPVSERRSRRLRAGRSTPRSTCGSTWGPRARVGSASSQAVGETAVGRQVSNDAIGGRDSGGRSVGRCLHSSASSPVSLKLFPRRKLLESGFVCRKWFQWVWRRASLAGPGHPGSARPGRGRRGRRICRPLRVLP